MSRYYDEDLDMYVDAPQTDASQQRMYFTSRISQIGEEKHLELRKTFGLVDDAEPRTPTELLKRIQDGKFVIPEKKKDESSWDPIRYFKWRDPAVKEDQAGFDAAWTDFNKARDAAKDTVMGLPADQAPATIKALADWTPTTAAS